MSLILLGAITFLTVAGVVLAEKVITGTATRWVQAGVIVAGIVAIVISMGWLH